MVRPVLRPLGRRPPLQVTPGVDVQPTGIRWTPPPVPRRVVLQRAARWMVACARASARMLLDQVTGRRGVEQVGRRVRQLFEEVGATGIKVGQQLSLRSDVLPLAVCDEMAKLQDAVPPFSTDYAIERVEATIGREAHQVFADFERAPIGSASIACVYRAVLVTGERVAVKVRRPGILEDFAADVQSLTALLSAVELTGLVRPAYFKHLKSDLWTMLMEELDFSVERRYQSEFGRACRRSGLGWIRSPKVYHAYCSSDVMVSEYVEGVPCGALLAAVRHDDRAALERYAELGVTPAGIAERLLVLSLWVRFEAPFFHGDPHPGNLILQPGDRIVILDFGSNGFLSTRNVINGLELLRRVVQDDISGSADVSLLDFTPMPHYVEVAELRSRLHQTLWRWLMGVKDPHAPWEERTTAGFWKILMGLVQAEQLPVYQNTLRLFRALMMYDTLAFRLHKDLTMDITERYLAALGDRVAKRAARRARRGADGVAALARDVEGFDRWLWHLEETTRQTELPWDHIAAVDRVTETLRLAVNGAALALAVVAVAMGIGLWTTDAPIALGALVAGTLGQVPVLVAIGAIAAWTVRRIRHRLEERR